MNLQSSLHRIPQIKRPGRVFADAPGAYHISILPRRRAGKDAYSSAILWLSVRPPACTTTT